MILKRLVLLFCLSASVFTANAQSVAAAALRDTQALTTVQNAITAMGGIAYVGQIQTAIVQGASQTTSAGDGSSATFAWTWAGSEFRFQTQAAVGGHTTLSGHGHPVDVRSGATVTMGQQLLRSELPFHIPALALLTVLNNPNYSMAVVETTTVDGKAAIHIHASDDSDATGEQVTPQEWYFDQGTGLPLRVEYRFPFDSDPTHWLACSIDFGNYQSVTGIQVPYLLSFAVGSYTTAATVSSVVFNIPVVATQFDPSSAGAQ